VGCGLLWDILDSRTGRKHVIMLTALTTEPMMNLPHCSNFKYAGGWVVDQTRFLILLNFDSELLEGESSDK